MIPAFIRFKAYILNEVFVPPGSRCCAGHIQNGQLSTDAIEKIKALNMKCYGKKTLGSILMILRGFNFIETVYEPFDNPSYLK